MLRILVSRGTEQTAVHELDGPVQLGRQQDAEESYPALRKLDSGPHRLVIAPADERGVSRQHLLLEPLQEGAVSVRNLSKFPVLVDGQTLDAHGMREIRPPSVLRFGTRVVVHLEAAEIELQSLADRSMPPSMTQANVTLFPARAAAGGDAGELIRWLANSIDVFQSAATSDTFFQRAAQAVVDAVGLDCGRVLLRGGDSWRVKAIHRAPHLPERRIRQPSTQVLGRVLQDKDTFWELPGASAQAGGSLEGISAVVAAPILSRDGDVIGVLYGDRCDQPGQSDSVGISRMEAMLVKLLASAVAAGLARLHEEEAALTARGRFEQFFTPELSRHLAEHPDLVERGRDCEVTVLFCDVRGFSRVSEQLGPARTAQWMNSVMDALSHAVREQEGVLVDYVGDELVAMWGAPAEQPDHAVRACRAALAMLEVLPALNEQWQSELQGLMDFGIGINTGPAYVGNTGSRYKFKYGPLGNTVNLASRVQGATKYLKTTCLVTQGTRNQLGPELRLRRLCSVRVVNIDEPVILFELVPHAGPPHEQLTERYESALAGFERGEFIPAAETLGRLLSGFPEDGPARILLKRVADAMSETGTAFDPVWRLPGK